MGNAVVVGGVAANCVVLGDVVRSRDIHGREAFGDHLAEVCESVSREFPDAVAVPFEPLKGVDEIGGVLGDVAVLYDVIDTIARGLGEERIRLAAVSGEVDVRGERVAELDGPAFHGADELLAELASEDLLVGIDIGGGATDELIAGAAHVAQSRKHDWTERERAVVEQYREAGTQSAAAERLGISQPAVSKALSRADYADVSMLESRIRAVLEASG